MQNAVYIETTIVSYLTCRPSRDVVRQSHEILTQEWWDKARPLFTLVTSDFVIQEACAGDPDAAAKRLAVLQSIPSLALIDPAMALAEEIATALGLPERARFDAAHVAMAAVHNVPFLLTWNCRHLANGALTAKIEESCVKFQHRAPRILTPEMLMEVP